MRYLPLTDEDRQKMLETIGVHSVDDLFVDVPKAACLAKPLDLPDHQGELEVERTLTALAARNLDAASVPSFLGAGLYRHFIPAAVDHLIQRGEFLTAYTPYQPEISQGTLQTLFEFQTQVVLLTGMEVANASMYDGATATAEAILMARRITRRDHVVISGGLHPHYRDVAGTLAIGGELESLPPEVAGDETLAAKITPKTACVVVQNPDFFGNLKDLTEIAGACQAAGALLIAVVTEALSLGAVESPGGMGADIVAAEGQSFGNALNFGGPTVGLLACREKFVRQMPGRLCGQTVDVDGRRGWVLTLSTREQHIRREKATSNICTNSGLCALAFAVHVALLGEEGLCRLALINHEKAVALAESLAELPGVELVTENFFNEFTVALPAPAAGVVERLAERRILAGVPLSRLYPDEKALENHLLVAVTELAEEKDMKALCDGLKEVLP
ncbi:MAG: aminomethyl-transferring glycine dehydrogenase subunit GcvPA [Alphaproteobacteria bacterium]|nr:aminomethyl-transferring glycine dehydrogenase subunit GcvPA [Alphaproteobacteria bacterium]